MEGAHQRQKHTQRDERTGPSRVDGRERKGVVHGASGLSQGFVDGRQSRWPRKTGQHPRVTTARNIENFRRQLQSVGFSYDWDREVSTTDPDYFRWTQWIFLQLYNSWFNPDSKKAEPISSYTGADPDSVRLAYVAEMPVNWCPQLGTVLANEEVVDGKSEVGGFPVERRPLRQWMLRITAFAERLIEGLDGLDWPRRSHRPDWSHRTYWSNWCIWSIRCSRRKRYSRRDR